MGILGNVSDGFRLRGPLWLISLKNKHVLEMMPCSPPHKFKCFGEIFASVIGILYTIALPYRLPINLFKKLYS